MAAHRYWRVYIDATSSAYVACMEIELFSPTLAKLNLAGATFSASSTGFGWVVGNAFNGDYSGTGVGWNSGTGALPGTDEWIKIDAGSGSTYDVDAFSWTSRSTFNEQAPTSFSLQWSDDDSTWTTLLSRTGETWTTTSETRIYQAGPSTTPTLPAPQWVVRFLDTDDTNDSASCAELQFRSTAGGSNLCTGGTPYATNFFNTGTEPDKAFDGSTSTFWSSTAGANSALGYILPSSISTMAEVVFRARASAGIGGIQSPRGYKIQYRNNINQAWADYSPTLTEPAWSDGEVRTLTITELVADSPQWAMLSLF